MITGGSATLAGELNIDGATLQSVDSDKYLAMQTITLVDVDTNIVGNFDTLSASANTPDYLTIGGWIDSIDTTRYDLGVDLSWYADSQNKTSSTQGYGTFTVDAGRSFEVTQILADTADNTNWDGKTLSKAGDGALILSAANTYSGETRVNDGALWLTDSGVIGAPGAESQGAINVAYNATLGGSGVVNGNVNNSGNVAMSQMGETGHTLTINGNYYGDDGNLYLNTELGDDFSQTDKLVISGNTFGNTTVYVSNANGQGAQTSNGIEVIDVGGQSDGVFTQGNQVQVGLYEYRLYQDGGDWYLRSEAESDNDGDDVTPQYRPDTGAYLGNQWMARNLQMQTLYDREGSQYRTDDGSSWMRFRSGAADSRAADGKVDIDSTYSQFQLGGDLLAWGDGAQSLEAGLMASYIKANTDSTANKGADGSQFTSSGSVNGYNLGIYSTWFADAKNHRGMYIDSWYQYGFYNNSVDNGDVGSKEYDSTANSMSLETGYRYDVALSNQNSVSLVPQAQVTWQRYEADSVIDNNDTLIDDQDGDSWTTRLGLRVDSKLHRGTTTIIQPFVEVNWLYTSNDVVVSFDNQKIQQDIPSSRGEAKVGIQANINRQLSITGLVIGQAGSDNYSDLSGSLNARYIW